MRTGGLIVFLVVVLVLSLVESRMKSQSRAWGSRGFKRSKKAERRAKQMMKYLMDAQKKEGILLASYVGDSYLGISGNKLVAVQDKNAAVLFDVEPKSDKVDKNALDVEVQLTPWINGSKNVITYNAVGEDINIEIPIENNLPTKSDSTIFTKVISTTADHPVYEIKSGQRKMCITLEPSTKEYGLKMCSNGSNDLQTFRFLTYTEAEAIESRRKGHHAFDLKSFLGDSKVPSGVITVADVNGVLYKSDS
ncbi:hypothetical protein NEHOM01_2293 [Nematocida homosporus]|uniref:uncharacterized protein n=1 Tax=Nematocida homosporus TaxID=1912981 RepID=UPI00221F0182|nr:uncharacterized protein NEHOM01_2293 [Nematocida homosporus]KAI5187589.1 hypothetical protein NEHOM01_2293 [Nematocida homosporus]